MEGAHGGEWWLEQNLSNSSTNSSTARPAKVKLHVSAGLILVWAVFVTAVTSWLVIGTRKRWFRFDIVEKDDRAVLVKSWITSQTVLLCTRVGFFVYSFGILIFTATDSTVFRVSQYYTIWNYTAFVVLFGLLALHSTMELAGRLSTIPLGLSRFTWGLFQVELANVFLVDVVLWTVLYPAAKAAGNGVEDVSFSSINVHGTNALMILAELAMNRIVLLRSHMVFVLLGAMFYSMVTWIRYAEAALDGGDCNSTTTPEGQCWPYFFMETRDAAASLWYPGLMLAHVAFFMMVWALSRVKLKPWYGARTKAGESDEAANPFLVSEEASSYGSEGRKSVNTTDP